MNFLRNHWLPIVLCAAVGTLLFLPQVSSNPVFLLVVLLSPILAVVLLRLPISFSLSPWIDSPESRAFGRQLKARPPLSHVDFYIQFYENSGIPFDCVYPLRRRCIECIGDPLLDRLHPSDNMQLLFDDLDLACVIEEAE